MTSLYDREGSRSVISLVCMPYVAIEHPSIGLGLLKARLLEAGIASEVHYANLLFAQQIGIQTYNFVSERSCTDFLGDWTFSRSAFPEHRANDAEYISRLCTIFRNCDPRRLRLVAWQIRDAAQSFVNRTAEQILARSPLIVGCTSTFQQHVASLALLRKIKELDGNVITMIGGANCEGKMGEETHRSFPWVDFVVSGEADDLIVPLCQAILDHGKGLTVNQMPNGVLGPAQKTQRRFEIGRQVVKEMDHLPFPDYDDYFRTVEEAGLISQLDPGLLIEASRGCWWGEKNHCTFCGLNGFGMQYRSKSSERLINEMSYLSHRYKTNKFAFVDNILDMKYFKDTLPELAQREDKFNMMFETKANLKQGQVHQLAEAGVFFIQPGIETMHSVLSKKLDKGNTPWINIQLLKWTLEQGIYVSWNFLYGLPGEEDVYYREITKWMPKIIHLQPPSGLAPIRFDRFSPYHDKQSEFGLQLEPVWSYMYNYPLSEESLDSLAYYFSDTGHTLETRKRCPSIFLLEEQVKEWNNQYYGGDTPADGSEDYAERPVLFQSPIEGGLKIIDTRPCAGGREYQISGLPAQVLTFCNEARNPQKVAEEFKKFGPSSISAAIDELIEKKILLLVENRLIGLPVSTPQRPMASLKTFPAGHIHPAKTGLQDPWSTPLTSLFR